jgi:hypothetical protein
LFGRSGVTRLIATDYKRTQQTLQPLGELLHLPVEPHSAKDVDGLVHELADSPDGAFIVVANHSNGVPEIAKGLGAWPRGLDPKVDALPDNEFNRVMVLSLGCDRAHATAIELTSD